MKGFYCQFQVCCFALSFLLVGTATALPSPFENSLANDGITETFLRVFPNYKLTHSPFCSLGEISDETFGQQLLFYSSDEKLPIIELRTISSKTLNAYSLPASRSDSGYGIIVVTDSLLRVAKDESAIAFVLAHEMAHLKDDHFMPPMSDAIFTQKQRKFFENIQEQWELAADAYAIATIRRIGFNEQQAFRLLESLQSWN